MTKTRYCVIMRWYDGSLRYHRDVLPPTEDLGRALEVARGCNHSARFCPEPPPGRSYGYTVVPEGDLPLLGLSTEGLEEGDT